MGWSLPPAAWHKYPATSGSGGAEVLSVQQLRELIGQAAAKRTPDVVFRGHLITRQLLTDVAPDYPFPPQVEVTRLAETTCQVSTEFVVWQHGDRVRQELLDGSPVLIHNGQTRWKVYYWPTDTFFRADGITTALREDDYPQVNGDLGLPPLPDDHARLLAGVDPIGEVTAVRYRDAAAWQFTMPIDTDPRDPRRGEPGRSSIIAADTGYLLRDWWDTTPQSEWFDIVRDLTVSTDHFRWTGPERSLKSLLRDRNHGL